MTAITRGSRVRLKQDGQYGYYSFTAGQVGTVIGVRMGDNLYVEFDGYEESRRANQELYRKYGEGFNLVPWVGEIPEELLEAMTEESK